MLYRGDFERGIVNGIIKGDWIEVLETLPDELVQCVITSPPYWGLRDYGTATWEGGSKDCDHKSPRQTRGNKPGSKQATNNKGEGGSDWLICGKCGAKRIDRQLGLEKTPEEYIEKIVAGFREIRRVLRKDGTVWLNLGDSYATHGGPQKNQTVAKDSSYKWEDGEAQKSRKDITYGVKTKDLIMMPHRVALALQADGWWVRMDIVWAKPNPMPESVTDRPTKSHEYIFLLTKSAKYFYDADAVREKDSGQSGLSVNFKRETKDHIIPNQNKKQHRLDRKPTESTGGRNLRSVWTIATQACSFAHFATFPEELVNRCILAGTAETACGICGAPYKREVELTEEYKNLVTKREKPNTDKLGIYLRESRKKLNMAQNEVSIRFPSKSGGLTGCVSNWESGKNVPTAEQWKILKGILGLNNDFDKEIENWWNLKGSGAWSNGYNLNEKLVNRQGTGHPSQVPQKYKTLAFWPSCEHDYFPIMDATGKCVVLDPFGGTNTVGFRAQEMGRNWISIELNPKYEKYGSTRTAQQNIF